MKKPATKKGTFAIPEGCGSRKLSILKGHKSYNDHIYILREVVPSFNCPTLLITKKYTKNETQNTCNY